MVKVEECCCGCTLRTGTLILLWTVLVKDCLGVLTELSYAGYDIFRDGSVSPLTFELLHWGSLAVGVTGMVISVLGIYAVQRNQPQFLIANICYFCFLTTGWIFNFVLLFIDRSLYYKIRGSFLQTITNGLEYFPSVLVVAYFFLTVISVYFALVIKSFRDTMIRGRLDDGPPSISAPSTTSSYVRLL